MRIHSLSPSIGLGIPVVPLVSQTRVSDFLKEIGLHDLAVDVFEESIEEDLYTKTRYALENRSTIATKVQQAATLSRERTKEVNQTIQTLLSPSSS
jgi:polysaccharide pyruvyl transferase WcaK-like protein